MYAMLEQQPTAGFSSIAKTIADADDLIQLLRRHLSTGKPWQRLLGTHLDRADVDIQVLRMTISLERPTDEQIDAAAKLNSTCRIAEAALQSSRADLTTRQAVRLVVSMSTLIERMLSAEASAFSVAS